MNMQICLSQIPLLGIAATISLSMINMYHVYVCYFMSFGILNEFLRSE